MGARTGEWSTLAQSGAAVSKLIPAVSLVLAGTLYFMMIITNSIDYAPSTPGYWIFLFLLFFGLAALYACLRSTHVSLRRPILGSALLALGAVAIYFGPFWFQGNWEDMGPDCLNGCSSSAGYYTVVYSLSGALSVLGVIAVVYGALFLRRRGQSKVDNSNPN